MIRKLAMAGALLLPTLSASAEPTPPRLQVGDTFEILMQSESASESSDGSSSTSHDRDAIIERVVGVSEGGLELEYDLPQDVTAENRAAVWQFPVRVFKPVRGPLQLRNGPELEARVGRWLEAAGMTRAACGHWIFTWNAFRIECDPQSVLETLEQFDLTPDELGDGTLYRDPNAREAAAMRRTSGPDGAAYVVEMAVDPDAVRRAQAESDLVVAEVSGETLTPEAALRAHADEQVWGTITVTFYPDADGNVRRRTRVSRIETRGADGVVETQTVTENTERRPVPRPDTAMPSRS